MLRFPLQKNLLFIIENNIYVGKIIFAGKDTITVKDLKLRQYSKDGEYVDILISNKIIIDRHKINSFSLLETPIINIIDNRKKYIRS